MVDSLDAFVGICNFIDLSFVRILCKCRADQLYQSRLLVKHLDQAEMEGVAPTMYYLLCY